MPGKQTQIAPFVGGAFMRSHGPVDVDVINPATGQIFLQIPRGDELDADRAVHSARQTFDQGHWRLASPSLRKGALQKFADLIEMHASALDLLDAEEMGKPIREPYCNAAAAAGLIRFCAEAADKISGDTFVSDKNSLAIQHRVPRGVVAAITPWNFPTFNAALKAGPALAAGNSVVLKPSELSSRSAIELALLAHEAGLPPGAFNVVPGLGATIGKALALHKSVDMITFTGSTATGKLMLQYAGLSNLKAVMAECGGKSPHIVFDDGVDLDNASAFIARHLLTNQGQLCSVGSRLLVQKSISAPLVERIITHLANAKIGDPREIETSFGPLASAAQYARVQSYIKSGAEDGAELAYGGGSALTKTGGCFIEPTLFVNTPASARIAREEIFGPVMAVTTFESEAEAIALANATDYGLAAYVWTASLATGLRAAKAIRATVLVNAAAPSGEGAGFALSAEPFGQSGLGAESGMAGIESYMRRHTMWFNHD